MWWPEDGSDEWLPRIDGVLCLNFGKRLGADVSSAETGGALEIGVWRGAWSSVLLKNIPSIRVVGVDPYPNLEKVRDQLLQSLDTQGVEERFTLLSETTEVEKDSLFFLAHIDGEHSQQATRENLNFVADHLTANGVIVVDDYRHSWFPGVQAALYEFLGQRDFKMFAATGNKAYLAAAAYASDYRSLVSLWLSTEPGFEAWPSWAAWSRSELAYEQKTDVFESPVLICIPAPQTKTLKEVAKMLLPPVLTHLIRNSRHRLRKAFLGRRS